MFSDYSFQFKEMLIFFIVMLVFLLAYGVGMTAIMTSDQPTLVNVLLRPYFLTTMQITDFNVDNKNSNFLIDSTLL